MKSRSTVRRKTARRFSICARVAKHWAVIRRRARYVQSRLAADNEELFKEFHDGSEGREVSTTMAFVGMLRKMLKDPEIGKLVVPIVPDEARTFGMESLFRTVGIYSERGTEIRTGRREYAALLQGSERRADSGRRNYGSGLDGVVYRGGYGLCDAAASTRFRFSFTTRCLDSSASETSSGLRRTCARAVSCSAARAGAPR